MERSAIIGLFLLIIAFIASVLIAKSLVRGTKLRTVSADHAEIAGSYTLILFGGTHSNDLETFAILDREDDQYVFEPYAPAFRFKTEKGVPARDALQKAEQFVHLHPEFHQYRVSKIVDAKGVPLGYEIRPGYFPAAYGASEVIDISYTMKDCKIAVSCSLTPSGEKIQNQQSGS